MEAVYTQLTNRAAELHRASSTSHATGSPDSKPRSRILIALAGPPGSGKSTVAAQVVGRLNTSSSTSHPFALVLPMDGFHLTRATLQAMPNSEEAIARRGVYWTFDGKGVVDLVTALHLTRNDLDKAHTAPSFDHDLKDPVEAAILINSDVQVIILEGNWLLFNEDPWSAISGLVDDTWFVDVDPALALERVARRHIQSGIETSWEQALNRATNNDMVNGDQVRGKLISPAIRVHSVEELNAGWDTGNMIRATT
jgi:pantothenate kinase